MANEQRLIDANKVKSKFQQHRDLFVDAWGGFKEMPLADKSRVDEIDNCIAEIVNAHTVDAMEVVRCEKYLYRSQYPDENGDYKCGGLLTEDEELLLMVKPDFFCAYGERR